ncbi:MAG: protocatechuate 3,4-dioxygenase beta subunit [Verrucomicrobiales bacterium]|jgi:protocatechuate 3,4-dioxygenase beta subunit
MNSHRRKFLHRAMAGSAAFFTVPGAFSEALTLTPKSTEGPFYPNELPLDTDNDLVQINDGITPAVGEITHFSGRIFDGDSKLVRNAMIEIWSADADGNYIHTQGAAEGKKRDANFQGYGRFLTGSNGRYNFRTIKPVPYGPRTPHIHVAVSVGGERVLTTQVYIKGYEQNARDRLFNDTPEKLRGLLETDYKPVEGSETGELFANWDAVIGYTPEDAGADRQRRTGSSTGFRPGGKGK